MKWDDHNLSISLTSSASKQTWAAEFQSEYIENITQRTGNFKKFPTFIQMMIRGLEGTSSSVLADLLTYQDLEMLKMKKGRSRSTSQSQASQDRRYFIVTYEVEFDKVHYPLPLSKQEPADLESLSLMVKKLQTENEALKLGTNPYENDIAARDQQRELTELRGVNHELADELKRIKSEMDEFISSIQETQQNSAKLEKMSEKVSELRSKNRQLKESNRTQIVSMAKQLTSDTARNEKQKLRIHQLESELESAIRSRQNRSKSQIQITPISKRSGSSRSPEKLLYSPPSKLSKSRTSSKSSRLSASPDIFQEKRLRQSNLRNTQRQTISDLDERLKKLTTLIRRN